MCAFASQSSCWLVFYFSLFNADVHWLPGSASPYGYSRQLASTPILVLIISLNFITFCLKQEWMWVQINKDWLIIHDITHWLLELFAKSGFFWTCWWFLGCILAKLPLIRSKMGLQHNSLPSLPPALRFCALWLGHAQKSKFWDEKVTFVFRLFDFWNFFPPFLFLLFFMQWLTFYWACLRVKNFWESVIEMGNF